MGTDAFGRRNDDAAAIEAAATSTPGAGPDGDRRPVMVPGWLVALILAVISLGGTAIVLVRAERAKLDDPVEVARRGAIVNLGEFSTLRADRLPRAYAAAVRGLGADEVVTQLAVAPTGLEIYVRDDAAFQRIRRVDAAFGVTAQDAGRSEAAGLRPAAVRFDGVPAIVRRVLARIPEPTAKVESVRMSLRPVDGTALQGEWQIRVADVRPRDVLWFASLDGRRVRRSDEPSSLTQEQVR